QLRYVNRLIYSIFHICMINQNLNAILKVKKNSNIMKLKSSLEKQKNTEKYIMLYMMTMTIIMMMMAMIMMMIIMVITVILTIMMMMIAMMLRGIVHLALLLIHKQFIHLGYLIPLLIQNV